jgi:hypothetical protein
MLTDWCMSHVFEDRSAKCVRFNIKPGGGYPDYIVTGQTPIRNKRTEEESFLLISLIPLAS